MNLTAVLEIVISLAAIYWLLSTGCSYMVEVINSHLLNVRAKALERFVCEMVLGTGRVPQLLVWRGWSFFKRSTLDPTKKDGKAASNSDAGSLADPLGLFSHGLVKSLRKPQVLSTGGASPPSYIPSLAFAQALLDRLKTLGWCANPMPAADLTGILMDLTMTRPPLAPLTTTSMDALKPLVPGTHTLLDLATALLRSFQKMTVLDVCNELKLVIQQLAPIAPAALSGARLHMHNIAQAALDALEQLPLKTQQDPRPLQEVIGPDALWMLAVRVAGREVVVETAVFDAVKHLLLVAPLPTSLKEALRPIVAEANFDADKLLKGIETWYEAVMDRASGWFKRNVTVMLGLIGFVAAFSMNISTINVVRDLKDDPGLRLAGVAAAEGIYRAGGRPAMAQQVAFLKLQEEGVWRKTAVAAEATASAAASGGLESSQAAVVADVVRFDSMLSAVRMRLLTSGAMAAAAGQAHAWAWARRSNTPKDLDYWRERDDLRKALCTGSTETDILAGKDVQANTNAAQQPMARRLKDWPACAWIHKVLPEKDEKSKQAETPEGRATELALLWQAPELVWHPGLSKALFMLYAGGHAYENDRAPEKLTALHAAWKNVIEQYDLAVKVAQDNAREAEDFLARIPSLQKPSVTGRVLCQWLPCPGLETSSKPLSWKGWDIFNEVVGWLITAVMVSFGAPFWFDLISKLLGQRGNTGPKPAPAE